MRKKINYSQLAFALFNKFGIVSHAGGLAVFEKKYDAKQAKYFYPKTMKLKIKPILITMMNGSTKEA